MVFSSLQFIFIFLPIFFLCYYLVPYRYKDYVLLVGSLAFYFVGTISNPEHMLLFIASIIADFIAAILIEKYSSRKKLILAASILFHIIVFSFFKYSDFVVGEICRFTSSTAAFKLIMPIGISFYTFQGISYIVDVYRGKIEAEHNLLKFSVYISMFEQLIAGPIVTYSRVHYDLHNRKIRLRRVLNGAGVFIVGLGLKVLLANPIGKLWSDVKAIGFESISTPLAWLAIFAFSFQLYFDFFGYSLMAVGLGRMLGFSLPKNFDHPYLSKSMSEFWRRWHMTLGGWFKEYLYIPLGGNRKGKLKTIRNLLIVWLFTGIWHGAGYNFILWGFVLFCIIALEKYCIGDLLNKKPVIGHLYMLLLIPLTWAIFAIDDISQIGVFYSRLFPFFGQGPWSVFRYDYLKYFSRYWYFFLAAILFSTKLPYNFLNSIKRKRIIIPILAAIFAASVYCMYRGLDDPFLYFRF